MNGDALIAAVREKTQDLNAPYLWSDEVILSYLREAEKCMCRETHVLIDPEYAATVVTGVTLTHLTEEVLRVYAARVSGETNPLKRLRGSAYRMYISSAEGKPSCFSTKLGDKMFTTYPVADADYDVELICAILPTEPIECDTDPQVPEEHHDALTEYAAYRCLIMPDEDGESVPGGLFYKDEWDKYLSDLKRQLYLYRTGEQLALAYWAGEPK